MAYIILLEWGIDYILLSCLLSTFSGYVNAERFMLKFYSKITSEF